MAKDYGYKMTRSCALCGVAMWECKTTAGPAVCRPCCNAFPKLGPIKLSRQKRNRLRKSVPCARCGEIFHPIRQSHRFCSISCAASPNGNSRHGRTCEHCGVTYDATTSDQRCCSRACSMLRLAATRPLPKPRTPKPCRHCGSPCPARRSAWCSDRCAAEGALVEAGERVMDLYRLACGRGLSGARWRQSLVKLLAERDGTRCQICRKRIDLTIKSGPKGSPRGPSIDHIIPRSKGGSDDLANLRLACWGCNQRRGNRGGHEQLALVG